MTAVTKLTGWSVWQKSNMAAVGYSEWSLFQARCKYSSVTEVSEVMLSWIPVSLVCPWSNGPPGCNSYFPKWSPWVWNHWQITSLINYFINRNKTSSLYSNYATLVALFSTCKHGGCTWWVNMACVKHIYLSLNEQVYPSCRCRVGCILKYWWNDKK